MSGSSQSDRVASFDERERAFSGACFYGELRSFLVNVQSSSERARRFYYVFSVLKNDRVFREDLRRDVSRGHLGREFGVVLQLRSESHLTERDQGFFDGVIRHFPPFSDPSYYAPFYLADALSRQTVETADSIKRPRYAARQAKAVYDRIALLDRHLPQFFVQALRQDTELLRGHCRAVRFIAVVACEHFFLDPRRARFGRRL